MNESGMYEILRCKLDKEGYLSFPRKARVYKTKNYAGQDFIEIDVVAHKDSDVYIIECKKPCTIEKFGFALGQLIGYKRLLEKEMFFEQFKKRIGLDRIDRIRYSIALLTTQKYPLRDQLETFKLMLKEISFPIRFITIDEKTEKCKNQIV